MAAKNSTQALNINVVEPHATLEGSGGTFKRNTPPMSRISIDGTDNVWFYRTLIYWITGSPNFWEHDMASRLLKVKSARDLELVV